MHYLMKQEIIDKLPILLNKKGKYGITRELAKKSEFCESYISQVLNRNRYIPRKAARLITHSISNEYEVEDVFEKV